MKNVRDYYVKAKFQVIVVFHSCSEDNPYNPHLHVVLNHCNLNQDLFYGTDKCYFNFKGYLERCTRLKWKFFWGKVDDYFE